MVTYPRTFPTSDGSALNLNDYNAIVEALQNSGDYSGPVAYLIQQFVDSGTTYYYAFDGSELAFGGPASAGGVAGANFCTLINAALTTAYNNGGGAVLVRAGTYPVTAPIIVYGNTPLIGEAKNATILQRANSANCDIISATNLWAAPVIYNFTLDGNYAHNSSGYELGIYGCMNGDIEHLTIINSVASGIYQLGSAEHMCLAHRFNDLDIQGGYGVGFNMDAWSFDASIVNSNIGNNYGHNLVVGDGTQVCQVGIWGSQTGNGLMAFQRHRIGITNCVIEHNYQHGVFFYGSNHSRVSNCLIDANGWGINGSDGININDCIGTNCTGNTFTNSSGGWTGSQNAIEEVGTSDYTALINNNVLDFYTVGISIIGANSCKLQLWDTMQTGKAAYQGANGTDIAIQLGLTTDTTQSHATIDHAGQISWGPGGSSALDTFLYREGVGVARVAPALKCDDIDVSDTLTLSGTTGTSGQTVTSQGSGQVTIWKSPVIGKQQIFIPFIAPASTTTSTSYAQLWTTQTPINLAYYDNITAIYFYASGGQNNSGTFTCYVDLFNVTDYAEISGTEISTGIAQYGSAGFISGNIKTSMNLTEGQKFFTPEIKVQSGGSFTLANCGLIIQQG